MTEPQRSHNDLQLDEIESGVVAVFSESAHSLGLPPSVGSIYGVFFASVLPLCLDDVVARLGISKGSASQGLRQLRQFGALRPVSHGNGRREYFVPNTELKKLVGGFLRSQLLPEIQAGVQESHRLSKQAGALGDSERARVLRGRLEKLKTWQRRGLQVLSLMERFLD